MFGYKYRVVILHPLLKAVLGSFKTVEEAEEHIEACGVNREWVVIEVI